MTHSANKRRDHNDAARHARRVAGGAAERGTPLRRSKYGRRLAELRRRGEEE